MLKTHVHFIIIVKKLYTSANINQFFRMSTSSLESNNLKMCITRGLVHEFMHRRGPASLPHGGLSGWAGGEEGLQSHPQTGCWKLIGGQASQGWAWLGPRSGLITATVCVIANGHSVILVIALSGCWAFIYIDCILKQ